MKSVDVKQFISVDRIELAFSRTAFRKASGFQTGAFFVVPARTVSRKETWEDAFVSTLERW